MPTDPAPPAGCPMCMRSDYHLHHVGSVVDTPAAGAPNREAGDATPTANTASAAGQHLEARARELLRLDARMRPDMVAADALALASAYLAQREDLEWLQEHANLALRERDDLRDELDRTIDDCTAHGMVHLRRIQQVEELQAERDELREKLREWEVKGAWNMDQSGALLAAQEHVRALESGEVAAKRCETETALALATEKLRRVEELHKPASNGWCQDCHDWWPCPTRRALEGGT